MVRGCAAKIALAMACGGGMACAPGRTARDANANANANANAGVPFPESAFTGPAEAAPRFETRRIGGGADGEDEGGGGGMARSGGATRFRGATVDLDLKGADLANVFRLLADVGHVNIVVDGDVTGSVTLRLRHVPWDQALDLVARTKGLDLVREGNVILVATRKR